MNFSAPFINRPIATTLLTAAVVLSGVAAFRVLPVSPLPQVDFPTVSVSASLPGASPEIMASSVATPLEREFGRISSVTEMTSQSTSRASEHHAAIRFEPQHRRGDARRRVGDQRSTQLFARQFAEQSDVQKSEPGRCADHDHRADLGQAAAFRALRCGIDHTAAAALAGRGGRAGGGRRQFGTGRTHRTQPDAAERIWLGLGECSQRHRRANRQRGQGKLLEFRWTLGYRRQRSAYARQRIIDR